MSKRASLGELLGVWLVGAAGVVAGYLLIQDGERSITIPIVAGAFLFFFTPLFLVVYSLVWAWPLAANGDRAAVAGLCAFALAVQVTSGWFYVGVDTITNVTVLMRMLAVLSPVVFSAYAASAAWAYHRQGTSNRRAATPPSDAAEVVIGR